MTQNVTVTVQNPPAPDTKLDSYPWRLSPTNGSSSPFTGLLSSDGPSGQVALIVTCPSGSRTYKGTSLRISITNASASFVTLNNSGPLTDAASGAACALPPSIGLTATFVLTTTHGSPVTSASNFWFYDN